MPDDKAKGITGEVIDLEAAERGREATIGRANKIFSQVADSFNEDWSNNPPQSVRAALGYWLVTATRHLRAISLLSAEEDLAKVAEGHYREMFEIQFQVRKLLSYPLERQGEVADRIAAWGILDYLDKMERFKNADFGKGGYEDVESRLKNFDDELIEEIKAKRDKGQRYWFGRGITQLARAVSKLHEELGEVYGITSAQVHGSWGIVLDVANPKPGVLDFRGFPNRAQMVYWSAELVDRAASLYLSIWNDIAVGVGAPIVKET